MKYEQGPATGPIRQGELIGPLWEHQPTSPPIELAAETPIDYISIRHNLLFVLSQDCDLLWDFQARFPDNAAQADYGPEAADFDAHPSCVSHVVMCDAFTEEQIRPRTGGSDIWKRIKGNQDKRYHHLDASEVNVPEPSPDVTDALPDLYLDFKKVVALPTRQLYAGLSDLTVKRIAVAPPIYLHDVIHRFAGYHSRVALPQP